MPAACPAPRLQLSFPPSHRCLPALPSSLAMALRRQDGPSGSALGFLLELPHGRGRLAVHNCQHQAGLQRWLLALRLRSSQRERHGQARDGWMAPKAVSCPKDVPLPASAPMWPLSALNKNLGSFFPNAYLCQVQFCAKCPCLSLLGRQRTHFHTLSVARVGLDPASPSPDTVPGHSLSRAQRRRGMPSLRCRLRPCKHSPACGTALAAHAHWMGPCEPHEVQQAKCKALHLGQGNPNVSTGWGMDGLRAALRRRMGGYRWMKSWT